MVSASDAIRDFVLSLEFSGVELLPASGEIWVVHRRDLTVAEIERIQANRVDVLAFLENRQRQEWLAHGAAIRGVQ